MSEQARRCPYVGLVPYSEEYWEYFFGRETETELIIANLVAARLTLLFGESGVGKSSVLRAGVAYRLAEQARQSVAASGMPEFAVAVFNTWRDDPLAGLTRAVGASNVRTTPVPETRFQASSSAAQPATRLRTRLKTRIKAFLIASL